MSSPRRKSQPYQPPAEFGRAALRLAESVGKTKEDILRATDYTSKTWTRLVNGAGSLLFAVAVRDVLQRWGCDVSMLPSLDDDDDGPAVEEWERTWLELGRRLYRFVSDDKYQYEIARLRKIVEAAEFLAEGTGDIKRR